MSFAQTSFLVKLAPKHLILVPNGLVLVVLCELSDEIVLFAFGYWFEPTETATRLAD